MKARLKYILVLCFVVIDCFGDTISGKVLWYKNYDSRIETAPVVWDGVIYFGTDSGTFYAIQAHNGAIKWRFETNRKLRSNPVHDHRNVYFGSDNGVFYALALKTGEIVWEFKTEERIRSGPSIFGSNIFFGNREGLLYSLNKETSEVNWKYKTMGRIEWIHTDIYVDENNINFGVYNKKFYSINRITGEYEWDFVANNFQFSSPAVSDSLIFIGGVQSNVYAIDKKSGSLSWVYCMERDFLRKGVRGKPVLIDDLLIFGIVDGKFIALRQTDGRKVWETETGIGPFKSGIAYNDSTVLFSTFYLDDETGCDDKCYIYGFDVQTGIKVFQFKISNPVTTDLVLDENMLYFGTRNGDFYAIKLYVK